MYVYAFDRRYGHDRVAQLSDVFSGSPGDLIQSGDEYFLILGESVAFSEFGSTYQIRLGRYECVCAQLLQPMTLELIHRFVSRWFTSYKKTLPLWLGTDISQILKRQPSKPKKKISQGCYGRVDSQMITWDCSTDYQGQQLIVVPTVLVGEQLLAQTDSYGGDQIVFLHSQMTYKQKTERFRAIKYGTVSTVICTYSQIFQDWSDLCHIVLLDQHARWYKNQQEPRYHTRLCIEKMCSLYGAEYSQTGYSLDQE